MSGSTEFHRSPAGAVKLTRTQQNILRIVSCNMVKGRLQTETKCRPSQLIIEAGGHCWSIRIFLSALNTTLSNIAGGLGAVEGGCECLALPGVWHWLEPMMNVIYGNPRNWPTPGSPSILRWKFPFSKGISSSGKAVEQPVRQHWRRGSRSFSSWRIQRRSERRGWIHALAAVNSAKPRNVNLSGSLNQWWGLNLVKSYTHLWFLFRFGRVYFGSPHFPAAETALKSRTI